MSANERPTNSKRSRREHQKHYGNYARNNSHPYRNSSSSRSRSCLSSQTHIHREQQVKHSRNNYENNKYCYHHYQRQNWVDCDFPNRYVMTNHVEISKELVRILRHGRYQLLNEFMTEDGYVEVDKILHDRKFISACGYLTEHDIIYIVNTNDKQRFTLKRNRGRLFIAATQGHTIQIWNSDLRPLTDPHEFAHVYHGTYYSAWKEIKLNGLSRMNRNHIHFATGLPDSRYVRSGMRKDVEVIIELNMKDALEAGLMFFVSSNGVVLSEGNYDGIIDPKFFKKVFPYQNRMPFY